MMTIQEGYQGLWETVAASLDVRCGVSIEAIRRDEQVTLTTDQGTSTFDTLILACPLHKVASVLDTTEEERALFGQIRTLDYQTVTVTVQGLGQRGLVFFMDNLTSDRAGHVVCGYRRWKDSDVWALYVMSDGTHDDATVLGNVEADLKAVGAQLQQVWRHDKWDFYPHVTPEAFRAGFYPEIEALQGRNHTFIVGEIMAAASVESVARYSRDLVQRHFSASVP